MTLTPEDVINKTFRPTRFSADGYNVDEVDDFLDEVVASLEALNRQIDELQDKLRACQAEVTLLKSQPAEVVALETPEPVTPVILPAAEPAAIAAVPGGDDASSAAAMLALAQRLHDEHVRNGQNRRDALIAEAQLRAEKLIADAEEGRSTTLSALESERDQLQRSIDDLRTHEREFRARMRAFFSAQLTDLENQQSLEPDPAKI